MKISEDKIQHFTACAVIAGMASMVMSVSGVHYWQCVMASMMVSMGCAVGKEFGDMRAVGNHWCWWDLLADLLGAVAGSLLFGMFTLT